MFFFLPTKDTSCDIVSHKSCITRSDSTGSLQLSCYTSLLFTLLKAEQLFERQEMFSCSFVGEIAFLAHLHVLCLGCEWVRKTHNDPWTVYKMHITLSNYKRNPICIVNSCLISLFPLLVPPSPSLPKTRVAFDPTRCPQRLPMAETFSSPIWRGQMWQTHPQLCNSISGRGSWDTGSVLIERRTVQGSSSSDPVLVDKWAPAKNHVLDS